ncbi:ATP-grasp domain-containing protein [Salmonella enterica]|nr:ATP-grasp domain-containing protein [Salmonella enterica]
MKKIFLQIGATRDGQNPYCEVAKQQGYFTILVEMGEFIDYQSQCMQLPFDMLLRLNHPENPVDILDAYMYTGMSLPLVVLAGFEAYNQSAGRLREIIRSSSKSHQFIPMDKYAQRIALKNIDTLFPQPDFHFFSSVSGIKRAKNTFSYPCVIKPVDGGGGLGIWLIKTLVDLDAAVDKLAITMNYGGRPFSGFIVESYLKGDEYSLQGVVCNGHPSILTCCKKVIEVIQNDEGDLSFYESGHVAVTASNLPESFISLTNFCCDTFGYKQGAFHIDFIDVCGTLYFLEMGFRLSGMGIVNLVKEVTGLNWAKIAFDIEQGKVYNGSHYLNHSHAVGQLRLRKASHLSAAKSWVSQNKRGSVRKPVKFPQVNIPLTSPLYADLTRHSGILGTLHLISDEQKEILSVFQEIISSHLAHVIN